MSALSAPQRVTLLAPKFPYSISAYTLCLSPRSPFIAPFMVFLRIWTCDFSFIWTLLVFTDFQRAFYIFRFLSRNLKCSCAVGWDYNIFSLYCWVLGVLATAVSLMARVIKADSLWLVVDFVRLIEQRRYALLSSPCCLPPEVPRV